MISMSLAARPAAKTAGVLTTLKWATLAVLNAGPAYRCLELLVQMSTKILKILRMRARCIELLRGVLRLMLAMCTMRPLIFLVG